MKKFLLMGVCGVVSNYCIAGSVTPLFLVTPSISAPSSIFSGQQTAAVYQVTNNTSATLNRTFNDIGLGQMPVGVSADTNSVSSSYTQYCPNPFTLAPGASCLLKVDLSGAGLPSGITFGPVVCPIQSIGVDCVQPSLTNRLNTLVSQGAIPQACTPNIANFNYALTQPLDRIDGTDYSSTWGPARNPLLLSASTNPDLSSCLSLSSPSDAQISWEQQRVLAAAAYWIAQKLNYCHHYNPDWATPVSEQGAAPTAGGYCNPAVVNVSQTSQDPYYSGSSYPYTQGTTDTEVRWNYSGTGKETASNWVNNKQMWYGVDCSNFTAFLYNFALGIQFDSDTSYQAGQAVGGSQDLLSPNTQTPSDILNNPNEAGELVCMDGTAVPDGYNQCASHGGYLSDIDTSGNPGPDITPAQLSAVLKPGDILIIAGGGDNPKEISTSIVTHAVLWLGKQAGYGANQINPSLIAPDDIPGPGGSLGCSAYSVWGPQLNESWVIADSHYQGADYRVLTGCFYLDSGHLWGVRRVIHSAI